MLSLTLVLACSTGSPTSGWLPLGTSDFGPGPARATAPLERATLPPPGPAPDWEVRFDPILETTDLVRLRGVERVQLCSGGDLQPVWQDPWLHTRWNVGTRGEPAVQLLSERLDHTPTAAASASPHLHSTTPLLAGGPEGQLLLTWSEGRSWGIGLGARIWDGAAWSEPGEPTASLTTAEPDESGLLGEASCAEPRWTEAGPEVRFRWDPGCAAGFTCTHSHTWSPQALEPTTDEAPGTPLAVPQEPLPDGALRTATATRSDGLRAVAWEAEAGGVREVFVALEQRGRWVGLSGSHQGRGASASDSHSVQPTLAFAGDRLCAAWSEMHDGPAEIVLRCHELP